MSKLQKYFDEVNRDMETVRKHPEPVDPGLDPDYTPDYTPPSGPRTQPGQSWTQRPGTSWMQAGSPEWYQSSPSAELSAIQDRLQESISEQYGEPGRLEYARRALQESMTGDWQQDLGGLRPAWAGLTSLISGPPEPDRSPLPEPESRAQMETQLDRFEQRLREEYKEPDEPPDPVQIDPRELRPHPIVETLERIRQRPDTSGVQPRPADPGMSPDHGADYAGPAFDRRFEQPVQPVGSETVAQRLPPQPTPADPDVQRRVSRTDTQHFLPSYEAGKVPAYVTEDMMLRAAQGPEAPAIGADRPPWADVADKFTDNVRKIYEEHQRRVPDPRAIASMAAGLATATMPETTRDWVERRQQIVGLPPAEMRAPLQDFVTEDGAIDHDKLAQSSRQHATGVGPTVAIGQMPQGTIERLAARFSLDAQQELALEYQMDLLGITDPQERAQISRAPVDANYWTQRVLSGFERSLFGLGALIHPDLPQAEEIGYLTPYTEAERALRDREADEMHAAGELSTARRVAHGMVEGAVDMGALLLQVKLLGMAGVPGYGKAAAVATQVPAHASNAMKAWSILQRVAPKAIFGYMRTHGDTPERLRSGSMLAAYNATPGIVNNFTRYTGLAAQGLDFAMNTVLTSPTYVDIAVANIDETNWTFDSDNFWIMATPQIAMDLVMSWGTRGLPENQRVNFMMREYGMTREEAQREIPFQIEFADRVAELQVRDYMREGFTREEAIEATNLDAMTVMERYTEASKRVEDRLKELENAGYATADAERITVLQTGEQIRLMNAGFDEDTAWQRAGVTILREDPEYDPSRKVLIELPEAEKGTSFAGIEGADRETQERVRARAEQEAVREQESIQEAMDMQRAWGTDIWPVLERKRPLGTVSLWRDAVYENTVGIYDRQRASLTQRATELGLDYVEHRGDGAAGQVEEIAFYHRAAVQQVLEKFGIEGSAREFIEKSLSETLTGARKAAIDELFRMDMSTVREVPDEPVREEPEVADIRPTALDQDGNWIAEPWREHPNYADVTESVPVSMLLPYQEVDRTADPGLSRDEWRSLAEDIAAQGIKEPLVMMYHPETGTGLLVEGNHRMAIAQELGAKEVPVRLYRRDTPAASYRQIEGAMLTPGTHPRRIPTDIRPSQVFPQLREEPVREEPEVAEPTPPPPTEAPRGMAIDLATHLERRIAEEAFNRAERWYKEQRPIPADLEGYERAQAERERDPRNLIGEDRYRFEQKQEEFARELRELAADEGFVRQARAEYEEQAADVARTGAIEDSFYLEDWQVPRDIYVERAPTPHAADEHRGIVERALENNRPVPASVLRDYPDLAPTLATPPTRDADTQAALDRLQANTYQDLRLQESIDSLIDSVLGGYFSDRRGVVDAINEPARIPSIAKTPDGTPVNRQILSDLLVVLEKEGATPRSWANVVDAMEDIYPGRTVEDAFGSVMPKDTSGLSVGARVWLRSDETAMTVEKVFKHVFWAMDREGTVRKGLKPADIYVEDPEYVRQVTANRPSQADLDARTPEGRLDPLSPEGYTVLYRETADGPLRHATMDWNTRAEAIQEIRGNGYRVVRVLDADQIQGAIDTDPRMAVEDWQQYAQQVFAPDRETAIREVAAEPAVGEPTSWPVLRNQIRSMGVQINMSRPKGANALIIDRLNVPEYMRDQGMLTKTMDRIVDFADREGLRLAITPEGKLGADPARVTAWLERYGFERNQGEGRDYTIQEKMIRPAVEPSDAPAVTQPTARESTVKRTEGIEDITDPAQTTLPADRLGPTHEVQTVRGTRVEVQAALVEADDLVASQLPGPGLRDNPLYPQERQQRGGEVRTNETRLSEVLLPNFNPVMLGLNAQASDGAPIFAEIRDAAGNVRLVAESGNARTLFLQRAYGEHNEHYAARADQYRQWLQDNALLLGVDPEQVAQMNKPVFVRVRRTALDPVRFAIESNEDFKSQTSFVERAKTDVVNVRESAWPYLYVTEDGRVGGGRSGDRFVNAFLEGLPASERAAMQTKSGLLSEEGMARIERAIFHYAYGDDRLLELFAHQDAAGVKNILKALKGASQHFAPMRQATADGSLAPEYDIAPDIARATMKIMDLREQGIPVGDFTRQNQMLHEQVTGERWTPLQIRLMEIMDEYRNANVKLGNVFSIYAQKTKEIPPPGQLALVKPAEPLSILNSSFRAVRVDGKKPVDFTDQERIALDLQDGTRDFDDLGYPDRPMYPQARDTEKVVDDIMGGVKSVADAAKTTPEDVSAYYMRDRSAEENRADTPIDRSPAAERADAMKLSAGKVREMHNFIRLAFGLPVNYGRFRKKGAAGIYKISGHSVRLAASRMRDHAVMHELGHHIDTTMGVSTSIAREAGLSKVEAAHELVKIGQELYPDERSDQKLMREGLAEFYSTWLRKGPGEAERIAPDYFHRFNEMLGENPGLARDLEFLRELNEQYLAMNPREYMSAQISRGIPDLQLSMMDRVRGGAMGMYYEMVDDHHYLVMATRALFGGAKSKTGLLRHVDRAALQRGLLKERHLQKEGKYSEVPWVRARLAASYAVRADQWIRGQDGVGGAGVDRDYSGDIHRMDESLAGIFQRALSDNKLTLSDLDAYLLAKHAVEVAQKRPGVITVQDMRMAEDAVRSYEREAEHWEDVARSIKQFNDHSLYQLARTGLIERQLYDHLVEEYEFYVPMQREMDEMGLGRFGSTGTPTNHSARVFRRTGSARPFKSPLDSIMVQTYARLKASAQNEWFVDLVKLADETEGMDWLIERVSPGMDRTEAQMSEAMRPAIDSLMEKMGIPFRKDAENLFYRTFDLDPTDTISIFRAKYTIGSKEKLENVMTVFVDGKPQMIQVAPDLYDSLLRSSESGSPLWKAAMKALRTPTKWLRTGVVYSPEFFGMNIMRDFLTTMVVSRAGVDPLDVARSAGHLLGHHVFGRKLDELFRAAARAGGTYRASYITAYEEEEAPQAMDLIRTKTKVAMKRLGSAFVAGEFVDRWAEGSKAAARRLGYSRYNAAAKKAIKEEWSEDLAMEMAFHMRDVTIDFFRHGAAMRVPNQITAFLNSSIQGADMFYRHMEENPKQFIFRTMTRIVLPGLALYYMYHRRGAEYHKDYELLPDWRKDLYFNVPIGRDKHGRPEWAVIPKGHGFMTVAPAFMERVARYLDANDPEAFDGFIQQTLGFLPQAHRATMLMPWWEVYSNTTWWGGPVVPLAEEGLPSYMQYDSRTSVLARNLGQMFNASPRQIDHVIRGYTGHLGKYGTIGYEQVARSLGYKAPDRPGLERTDWPVFGSYVRGVSEGGSTIVQQFYEDRNAARLKEAEVKESVERGYHRGMTQEQREKMARDYVHAHYTNDAMADVARGMKILRDIYVEMREGYSEASQTLTPEQRRRVMVQVDIMRVNLALSYYDKEPWIPTEKALTEWVKQQLRKRW